MLPAAIESRAALALVPTGLALRQVSPQCGGAWTQQAANMNPRTGATSAGRKKRARSVHRFVAAVREHVFNLSATYLPTYLPTVRAPLRCIQIGRQGSWVIWARAAARHSGVDSEGTEAASQARNAT
ncbi:uncharacterized protein IWZ02DRAFT_452628 [Phyllosticta citriasiana]|uniref:Uncharacterized protein n=1 Tax=Phyllosticta citriasiana TaxID=595635 RepID=A0ABR1KYY1_9PEZI